MALPPLSRPSAVIADLRAFLASRERYHWVFAALSVLITSYLVAIFLIQSATKEYRPPEIVWVKNFAANRSDAEIKAQQKIDEKKREAEKAEQAKLEREQREQAARLSKKLGELGI